MSTIYTLYKNNENVGFVSTKEDAMDWLSEMEEKYNLDPDYSFVFEYPDPFTIVVHSKCKWFVPSYYKYEDTYLIKETPTQY